MNISLQNNDDNVSALLTVKMEKADYEAQYEKALKKYRQQARIPGFRPGMVPMNLIKKMYGKALKAEEVNKVLGEKVYGYIRENKVAILGEPLPNEDKQPQIDFDNQDEFEFLFDLALAPAVKVEIGKDDTLPYYHIDVTDEMVDNQINMYRQRGGSYESAESYEDKDMLKGTLVELGEDGNAKEGGLLLENTLLMPTYMKDDAQKALFDGKKVGETVVFNPTKAYNSSEAEIAALLKVEKTELANHTGDFSFEIKEISRFKMADFDQNLYDSVFEKGTVTTEADFRAKVKSLVAEQYAMDSDYKFLLDVRSAMEVKVGKVAFADKLLKRIMLINSKDKDEKAIDANYEKSTKELTWHLIKEELVKQTGVKVDDADLKNTARDMVKMQFAQYGMLNAPDEILDKYAAEMMTKQESAERVLNRAVEVKLTVALKGLVTLDEKTVSVDEFNKMIQDEA
ncbi:MAG: trigger factor [Bacteroidaceae bacterium]|jgi:trigger factor